ncbi:fasciclin domain-containing protein [Nocardioides sp.]|uniref:fasciclin domain-containing protein n=1 Tax=Nocardioides sp. TaxID=35761 RepID=UPI001A33A09E|nr:fasciclin domain-containing protein [Nocardioides sp.]MBJ7358549.1 fasciclin domain-containing protein [Nocardioides sp.]
MKHALNRRLGATILGLAVAATTGLATAPAQAAAPAQAKAGDTSLAEVLGADGQKLDKNWGDFDLVEAAVFAVLDAKPGSPVGLLADGDTRLTAFVPTDAAFRSFVQSIKGYAPKTEAKTLKQVVKIAGSIDTIETILLYHVVAGKTLTSPKVLAAEGDKVTTAQGGAFRVHIGKGGVFLVDKDRDAANPYVVVLDVNRGNKQVAHGINRVLRPVDL